MFDRYAAATAPSWGRRALVMASILLHVSAGIALAIYSVFHIEEIAPPAISLTFFSAPPPPPPPPAGHKKSTPKTEIKKPTQQVQPVITPQTVFQPKKEEPKEDEDDGEEGGVEGGVKGGVAGGVVGGVVGSNGPPKGGGGKMVPMFTLMASIISAPDPHVDDAFKSQHPNQTVKGMYKVCIAQDGSISDVTTLQQIGGQDASIISQIKSSWKYKPQPLPVCFVKPILFKIN